MSRKVFIGVAWPYVNGDLHIGHLAGYLLPADIQSRYQRLIGNETLMVSGSDCFGTPITVEAEKRGITPKEVVEEYHEKDVDLFLNTLNLTYDLYTRTDHENHLKVTQDFFVKLLDEGYIFTDKTEQYYSGSENRFLPDRYVIGTCPYCGYEDARSDQCDKCGKLIGHGELIDPLSNINKEPVILKETEHYFMDWEKLQSKIEPYVQKASPLWKTWVRQETLGWLKEGLKPRAITRDIDWGVPIPVDRIPEDKKIDDIDKKRIYVWFEAVIGYYSASKLWGEQNTKDWESFWYGDDLKHYYFMGKDNLVFHTMFWPGQLAVYDPDIHLPDIVSINMFLDFGGKAFSKSRGVTISSEDFVKEFGNDAMRFYLTYIMPEVRDSSFNWSDFEEKVNGVLVANLGNFVHRVLSMAKKEDLGDFSDFEVWDEVSEKVAGTFSAARTELENCAFRNHLSQILELSSYGNSLVDREKLWELKKTDQERFHEVLYQLMYVIIALKYLMAPVLPHSADKISEITGTLRPELWPEPGKEKESIEIEIRGVDIPKKFEPLFTKLENLDHR